MTEKQCIYQNNDKISLENKEVEPIEPAQMNIYQSKTCRKDLTCLHFDNEPNVQGRQQVKDQYSYISLFVVYLTIPSSGWEHQPKYDNSIPCTAV